MIFGRHDDRAGEIGLDDSIEHVKAVLLIHAIRSSPGGHKLSNEMVLWLATHFQDVYLPSNAPAMAEMIEEANKSYSKNREDPWYAAEQELDPTASRGLRGKILQFVKRFKR